jgi:DNA-binding transcriptional MerR regulator
VGVPETSLRAWERRYGLLAPQRSSGGFRIYSDEDAERVAVMLRGLEQGLSAAEAAHAALNAAPAPSGSAPGQRLTAARERLIDAVRRYDEAAVHGVLDEVLAAFGLEPFLTKLILPALEEIGRRWEQGELEVSMEHFASNLPGEHHDISLIAFGLILRTYGWRIVFLGADTPIETVQQAITATQPTVTVLAGFTAERLEAEAAAVRRLARRTAVVVSGPGATEGIARRLRLRRLDGDVVRAARELAEGPPDLAG